MSTYVIKRLAPAFNLQLLGKHLPGLGLSVALAVLAMGVAQADWFAAHGLSALTLAIAMGMIAGNTFYSRLEGASAHGVQFARGQLLRLGIVLYGLRLTVQDIGHVGIAGVVIDALVVMSTFGLGSWLGTRWLGLNRNTAMLISAGSAICGAAAVLATAPILRGKAGQVSVAVATVVVFGTLAIFAYPALYALNQHWPVIPGGAHGFGIYTGSTIHEVAQVVAAARSIGPDAADAAVIAKMVRVMLLAPFLIGLSAWLARRGGDDLIEPGAARPKLAIPWFAFGFIAVVVFNSLHVLPTSVLNASNDLDTLLLAIAMAALGLGTRFSALRAAGIKPLVLAAVLFAWLVIGGGVINHVVTGLLR